MTNSEKQEILDSLRAKAGSLRDQYIKYNWSHATPEQLSLDRGIKALEHTIYMYSWTLFPEAMSR